MVSPTSRAMARATSVKLDGPNRTSMAKYGIRMRKTLIAKAMGTADHSAREGSNCLVTATSEE